MVSFKKCILDTGTTTHVPIYTQSTPTRPQQKQNPKSLEPSRILQDIGDGEEPEDSCFELQHFVNT